MRRMIRFAGISLVALTLAGIAGLPQVAAQGARLTGGGDNSGLRFEVELRRSEGDMLMMRIQVANEGSAEFSFFVTQVSLIDAVNKKRYLVVTDNAGSCYCSGALGTQVEPGKHGSAWAKFGVPPPSVRKLTVLIPGIEPIEDVPIADH
jgi:hypothetical protein